MSAPEEFCLSRAIQMFALLLLLLLLFIIYYYGPCATAVNNDQCGYFLVQRMMFVTVFT